MSAPAANDPRSIFLGVVILAAGASTRMGQPKMLLPWGRTSVIGRLIEQWQPFAAQTAIVCAAHDSAINRELDRLRFPERDRVINPTPELGMFNSVQCAARWSGWKNDLTHWMIVLGDQPHLQPQTLQTLINFGAAHAQKLCQPIYSGHARHPVLLPASAWVELRHPPENDLRAFLKSRREDVAFCEIGDPGLDLDLDRPSDYERAIKLAF